MMTHMERTTPIGDYFDADTLVSGIITVAALAVGGGNNGKNVIFKNCAPFMIV